MRNIIFSIISLIILAGFATDSQASTRRERQLVAEGNKLYTQRKFAEAASIYAEALKENPNSASAKYNLGLAYLRQVTNPEDTTPKNKQMLAAASKNFAEVAQRSKERPGIAEKANYNLGNLAFNTKDYAGAIQYYKQALRIDPNDNNARHNLRIAQKQLENQNKDKNKDQNQNKDENEDKDRNQDKDKQNNQNNQDQNKNREQQPQEQQINQQTAERILQAMDNKENQTRTRVNRATKGDRSTRGGGAAKRW